MKTLKKYVLGTCLGVALFLSNQTVCAQSNLVMLVSQTGDYIGQGQTCVTTNLSDFSVSSGSYGLDISAFGYDIWATGPNRTTLTVGDYANAARDPFNGGAPGLSVAGNGRGCNTVCGNFSIYELDLDNNGNPTHLWITFTQQCECFMSPMTGEIRFHSQLAPPAPVARVLRVPQDYPTIQSAINDSSLLVSDTILVSPGIYNESVNFSGRPAHLMSVAGPTNTWLLPPAGNAGFIFGSGETSNSWVCGFTITNGGSGVSVSSASPTICSNIIVNCGTGVNCSFASPAILDNYIAGSTSAAINLFGAGSPLLAGNMLVNNSGGGVYMFAAGSPTIMNNVIKGNGGDGLGMVNQSDANIIQNIIMDNAGNGVSSAVPANTRGPYLVNNTIIGNQSGGIWEDGFPSSSLIENNIVLGTPAITMAPWYGLPPAIVQFNDFYSPNGGTVYNGDSITNLTGLAGNISLDPWFACEPEGDFHLVAGSSCIDAGTNDLSNLLTADFDGNPRILAGISHNVPTVDMGAYEFNPLYPPTQCLFVNCQTDIVVYTAVGQNSAVVTFPTPSGSSVATIQCSPPSGSTFYGGTNVVTCTATSGTNSASCSFNVIVVVAPTITQPPQNLQVSAGQGFTLSVGASGTPPLYYQWSFQGNPIYGANSAALTIPDAQSVNDGVYSVLVYNAAGFTNSPLARVRVLPAKPVIVTNPASLTAPAGSGAGFSVIAAGSEPMTYQWYFNSRAMVGANAAQLSLTNIQSANAGNYSVTVSNLSGAAKSRIAVLNVKSQTPYFVTQPSSITLLYDSNATLIGQAAGSQPIHYLWYFNGQPLPNQNNQILNLSKVKRTTAGNYYLVAINLYGKATSAVAQVTVDVPPQLVRAVSDQIVKPGQNVTLSEVATGDVPIVYSWTFNGTPISFTGSVLNLTNIQSAQGGYYTVTVSNAWGLLSSTAKISVFGPSARLIAWGDNTTGQTNVPDGLRDVVAAAGGDFHSVALRTNGKLVVWGDNSDGQTHPPAHLPPIVCIAAGASHNLAIGADGSMFAWGNNASGQCNIPSAATNQPMSVSAGDAHSLALLANGTVIVWGDNTYGQMNLPDVLTPEYGYPWWDIYWPNPNWIPASTIATGRNHNLAVLTNGVVAAWGDNSGGQCDVPADLTNAVAVAGGYLHSVALRADGTVTAWGDDAYGQTEVPVGLTNVVAITAGDFNTLALLANGSVVAWGDDSFGQDEVPANITNAVGIASGYYHSMALLPATGKK